MKKPNIKHLGLRYSAYSDRSISLRKHTRRHKRETTVKAVSILIAANLIPLTTTMYV